MSSVVDERGRIVIPKAVTEELQISKGEAVMFEKIRKGYVIRRLGRRSDRLREILEWNPKRTRKPEPTSPAEMKAIWRVK